jgi:predicted lipid-binding transport protein (Tim44 family)
MTDPLSPSQAQADLARADASARRIGTRARWMSVYLAVFGVGFGALTLVLGLAGSPSMTIVMPLWGVLIAVMVVWSQRQLASRRGTGRRVAVYWVGTGALYGIALFVGDAHFPGRPAFWIPAALIVAAPLLAGAIRERRA